MIPKQTVEAILDAARIEEVVGDFVSLKRRGANLIACCPFHNEKTPSFYVSPAKGIFKCFGCGESGTAVGFIMKHESLSYVDALKYLARKYHIDVVEREESAEEIAARQKGESLMLVSEFAKNFFSRALGTEEGRVGYAYFKSRGLEDDTVTGFGLGWAPASRTALLDAARKAGYKEKYLIDTGLCFRTEDGKILDRFHDRVVFPITDVSGRVIAFGCRTLKSDKSVPKYVNSPETEIYSKRNTLYGIFQAKNEIHRRDKFILVEGYLDVISLHQLGIRNVAASSGTSLTVEQVRLIKRFTDNITIIYDGDSAGIHAALRGIGLVLEGGLNVKVVLLPDGDDPDSFARRHTLAEVENFIRDNEQDFISFKTRFLLDGAGNDPIRKAGLINDVADTIALIPDPVKRSVYVQYAATELGVEEVLLFERIKRVRRKMLEDKRKAEERKREGFQAEESAGFQQDYGSPATEADTAPRSGQAGASSDSVLTPCETELLGFILRNGRTPLEFLPDSPYCTPDRTYTVAEFIDGTLYEDGAEFASEPLRLTYEKYFELYSQKLSQEQISVRLLNDGNPAISATARELIEEKHKLTIQKFEASLTSENTTLTTFVPKALIAYNRARVCKELKELSRAIKKSDGLQPEDQEKALARIQELNNLKNKLTTALGRV